MSEELGQTKHSTPLKKSVGRHRRVFHSPEKASLSHETALGESPDQSELYVIFLDEFLHRRRLAGSLKKKEPRCRLPDLRQVYPLQER